MAEDRPLSSRGGALIVLLGAVLGMNQLKVSPVVAELIAAGYGEHAVAWLMSIYAVGGVATALALLFAPADSGSTHGRAAVSVVLLAGAGLAGGLWPAPPIAVFLLLRLAESIGFTALAVYAPALLASAAPPRRAGLLLGLWAMWMPLGQLTLFLLAAAGVGARAPLWTTVAILTFAVGGAFLVWVGPWLRAPSVRMARWGRLPALAPAAFGATLYLAFSVVFAGLVTWIPFVMRAELGIGARAMAFAMAGYALCNILGNWLAPRLVVRHGVFRVTATGFAGLGVLILLLALDPGVVAGVAVGVPLWIAAGMTVSAVLALPIWIAVDMGNAYNYACLQIGRWVGTLIGPLVLATAIAHGGGWSAGLMVIACVALGAVPMVLWAARRWPQPAAKETERSP